MKRIVTLSLLGALTLGMLATGVAGAHQDGNGGKPKGPEVVHAGGLGARTTCVLAPTVNGAAVFAKATPGKPGGSINVEIRVKHADTTVTTFGATVTPTFPTAGAGPLTTLTRKGSSFVLKGTIPVPSTSTAGSAALAVAGTYGSSTFTCAGLAAKVKVAKAPPAPVCTSTPTGLGVRAFATPAVPGGMLRVMVVVKQHDPSATLAATATVTIPPAAATPPQALAKPGKWAVLTGSFPVDKGASLGAKATVSVSGTYTASNATTSFTCSLSTPIKSGKAWRSGKVH